MFQLVRGYGKGKFANGNQRKAVMSKYNHTANRITDDPTQQFFSPPNILNSETILKSLAWSGCGFFLKYCLVIKGVNQAYIFYKENRKYKEYEHRFKNIIQKSLADITTEVTKNKIGDSSESIIDLFDESGLLDLLSKETNADKDTIREIFKGTTTNLLMSEIETISGFF